MATKERSWFVRIVSEGVAVAAFLLLGLYLPVPQLQIFFLALLFYVLWMLFRNPRYFYRRLAHSALWVLLLPPLGELSIKITGHSRGEAGGIVGAVIELGGATPAPILFGLVLVFVAADLLSGWLDDRRYRDRMDIQIVRARLYTEADRRYDIRLDLLVTAPASTPIAIGSGARFRASPWGRWTRADVYPPADRVGVQVPLGSDETWPIDSGDSTALLIAGAAQAGRTGRWLSFWSRGPRLLAFSYGAIELAAGTSRELRRAPVTFRLLPPPQASPEAIH